MAELNLNGSTSGYDEDFDDSIIIVQNDYDIPGGKVLDTTGFSDTYIVAGHGVIQEDGTDNYKPLPAGNDAAIPVGHTAVGVVIATVLTSKPAVGVMQHGVVNNAATKYSLSAAFQAATQTGGLGINYMKD